MGGGDGALGGPDGAGSGDGGGGAGCDAAALNFAGDPRNCGRCGHDCLGGGCEAGACLPFIIWDAGGAWYVAVDDSGVYFTNDNLEKVQKLSKNGGPPSTITSAPQGVSGLLGIAIDTAFVYYTAINATDAAATGAIFEAPIAGGASQFVAQDQDNPINLIAQGGDGGTELFWINDNPDPDQVMQKVGNGAATMIGTGDPGSDLSIAVFGTELYLANDQVNGTLKRCTVPNCQSNAQQLLASDPNGIDGVVRTPTRLIWGLGVYPGNVTQTLLDGGSPEILGQGDIPHSFIADDSYVYWVSLGVHDIPTDSYDNGYVQRCPMVEGVAACGTGPEHIGGGYYYVHGLTQDSNSIYWVEGGNIWRFAK
jgi:hypothetical protein